ncbi:MAG: hypothetical protein HUJ86_03525, partial [Synergistes sp.]|nr:hypothetical protein [Synergistes sp.]
HSCICICNKSTLIELGERVEGIYDVQDYKTDFLFFHDSNCKKAILETNLNNYVCEYELKTHDFLGGAYYTKFGKELKPGTVPTSFTTAPEILPSAIYPSEIANPFYFPAKYSCSAGSDRIYALASNTEALSQGQFGAHPLYAFTGSGIWALSISDEGTFSAVQPVNRDVVTNPNAVLPLSSSVLYCNRRGVIALQGINTELVSKTYDGDVPFSVANFDTKLDLAYLDVPPTSKLYNLNTLREFVSGDIHMAYDYVNSQVIITNSDYDYSWVLSLKSNMWSILQDHYLSAVNAYPDALLTKNVTVGINQYLYIYSANNRNNKTGRAVLYISRPMSLGDVTAYKTVTTAFAVSETRTNNGVYISLYGSNNLIIWKHLADSNDVRLRGFSGSPWRYFRFVIRGTLYPGDNLSALIVEAHQRFPNRLRF